MENMQEIYFDINQCSTILHPQKSVFHSVL